MQNKKLKILADENMPMAREIFSRFGEVILRPGREIGAADLVGIDALLVRSVTRVDQALLADSPVQFVGTATIGTDHVDQAYLAQRKICFSNAPGCNADAVVEYVLSCIFLLAAQQGFNPAERVYGIIGVGNVGGRLQRRLQALGYKVLLNDPPRAEQESGFVELDSLLQQADIICAHTPLTRSGKHPSYHLLGSEQLGRLRENAILLNAGRGPVIDNTALLQIGRQRSDLTFVLDVWEHEPAVDPALAQRCAIVSPHIAGYSLDGKIRGTYMLYQALCRHLGEACGESLNDFLPEAELAWTPEEGRSPLEIMQLIYDPREDDRLLRETLNLPLDAQKKAFDQLRKGYRVRREFAALEVADSRQPELLKGLGFRLAERD
ncbi:4-phosphoerythronate dehydrogenase PdxB [Neptuniibacter halophilus]|uniref:4-phosphoerythronate dehydrogenase PdxB n=1 Tax=Neptuniibacter halophilus TaxID=651666 RepID=UPI00257279BC|nr:4-phosphoerythronate dehydrogenase PdxB [Neptuniibacter halophilus]